MQFCADLLHSALFSISLFFEMRCRSLEATTLLEESVEFLKTVQAEFEATDEVSRFNSVLGHITAYLGLHLIYILQYDRSREYLEEAVQLLDNSQSRVERAQAQVMLAAAYPAQGRLLDSTVMLEQSREVFREEGQHWWYVLSTINLASHYAVPEEELREAGILEVLGSPSVVLVEWGERLDRALVPPGWDVRMEHTGAERRRITVTSRP